MKISNISKMNTSSAIILGSIIIGVSFFMTIWIFFGGEKNGQKNFAPNQMPNKNMPTTMTPEQIKKIQEERAAQMRKQPPATSTTTSTTE